MVEQWSLEPRVEVRVLDPEPIQTSISTFGVVVAQEPPNLLVQVRFLVRAPVKKFK